MGLKNCLAFGKASLHVPHVPVVLSIVIAIGVAEAHLEQYVFAVHSLVSTLF